MSSNPVGSGGLDGFGIAPNTPLAAVTNPTQFSATPISQTQINLAWTDNGEAPAEGDSVLVAFNTTNTFGTPADGSRYAASDDLGGATVLQYSGLDSLNHTGLTPGTKYYYKIWSYDGSAYSTGVVDSATTLKGEPDAHVTSLTAAAYGFSQVNLSWTDASGSISPDGYLIKVTQGDLASIADPVDGTAETDDTDLSDGAGVLNVAQGVQTASLTGLTDDTTYTVKVFPYSNSGSNIDYYTGGTVPTAKASIRKATTIFFTDFDEPGTTLATIAKLDTLNDDGVDGFYYDSYGGDNFAEISAGIFEAMIIGPFNLDRFEDEVFSFYTAANGVSGAPLSILYATDYNGDPTTATWNDITAQFSLSTGGYADTFSGLFDASSISGTVHFGFSYDGFSGSGLFQIDDISLLGVSTVNVDAPTGLAVDTVSSTQLDVSWSGNVAQDSVLLAFGTSPTFGDPVDGQVYSASEALGDATVLYFGPASTFSHTGLTAMTTYYYKAWSYDGSFYSLGTSASGTTAQVEPDGNLSLTSAVSTPTSVALRWTDATGSVAPDGYLFQFSSAGSIADPVDGTFIADELDFTDGAGAVNVAHGVQVLNLPGLVPDTSYSVKVYAYTNSGSAVDYLLSAVADTTFETSKSLFLEDFEDSDVSYTTSVAEFSDGFYDFFGRVGDNGITIASAYTVNIPLGTGYFVAQDLDAEGGPKSVTVQIDSIEISGYTDLDLSLFVAEEARLGWDAADSVHISAQIDNGSVQQLIWLETDSTTSNQPVYLDTDFDGFGDGPQVTDVFTPFSASITGRGQYLHLRIQITLDSGDEDIAFDHIEISGVPASATPAPSSPLATVLDTASINLTWTENADADHVLLAFSASESFGTPVNGLTYAAGDSIGNAVVLQYAAADSFTHASLASGTTYYYQVWSYDGFAYSEGVTFSARTHKLEPTGVISGLTLAPDVNEIAISWTEPTSGVLPDGYLVYLQTDSTFTDPVDSTVVTADLDMADSVGVASVAAGGSPVQFTGLRSSTTYFVRVVPFTNSGVAVNYSLTTAVDTSAATTGEAPAAANLFFSEYIEGASNNKALEIYNASEGEVPLTFNGKAQYFVMLLSNPDGTKTWEASASRFLFGPDHAIASGDVFVIGNASAVDSIKTVSDTTGNATFFNGNDPVALVYDANRNGTYEAAEDSILDVIGTADGTMQTSQFADVTLVRKSTVFNGTASYDSTQWLRYPQDTFRFLGSHSVVSQTGAAQLAVESVNGGRKPSAGTPFSVVVKALDLDGEEALAEDTVVVRLSASTDGSGTLGGELVGKIAKGTSRATISGVTFSLANTAVTLTVADTLGGLLSGSSTAFEVLGAADSLVIANLDSTGFVSPSINTLVVEARRTSDGSLDSNYVKTVTLAKATGAGELAGTLSAAAVAGKASFTDLSFSQVGAYTLKATDGTLTSDSVATITISEQPPAANLFFSEYLEGSSNNKAVEIFNNSGEDVTLSRDGKSMYFVLLLGNPDGSKTWEADASTFLFGDGDVIKTGGVYVIGNPSAADSIKAVSDTLGTATYYNGNDPLALVYDRNGNGTYEAAVDSVLDVIGTADGTMQTSQFAEVTLVRKSTVFNGTASYDSTQWLRYPQNTSRFLGSHSVVSQTGAAQLAVESVNGGRKPSAGTPFSVVVTALDLDGEEALAEDTVVVRLSASTDGSGTLGGELIGKIAKGTSRATISGVTFSLANTAVTLTVADTLGGLLSGSSAAFEVLGAADSLVIATKTTTTYVDPVENTFRVEARRSLDGSLDSNFVSGVSLAKVTGSGVLGGTLTKAAVNGVATFADVTFTQPGTYTMRASSDALVSDSTYSVTVDTVEAPANLFFSEYIEGSSNNKALEIYNASDEAVVLNQGGENRYLVILLSNADGVKTWEKDGFVFSFKADASIEAGKVYVIGNDAAVDSIKTVSDEFGTATYFNGDDPVALVRDYDGDGLFDEGVDVILDLIGADDGTMSKDVFAEVTLVRSASVAKGTAVYDSTQWVRYPQNTFAFLGQHNYVSTSVDREQELTPVAFHLEQNYPNPFNPTTTIQFSIEKAGPVRLEVYNMVGHRVSVLVDANRTAGSHQVVWNAAGMASGVYYARLISGGQVMSRKMTLLK